MFISFEGGDGSGKSTQIHLAAKFLQEQGYDVLLTHEPGGTSIGEQIREIVLNNKDNTDMSDRTELLLFCASRAQLVEQVLRPHLAKGGIVLSDRYADSTMAYQGYGLGLDLTVLRQILDFATGGLYPDKTIYLDIPPHIGLGRRKTGADRTDRLDDKELEFHERVYMAYGTLVEAEPDRFFVINANQTPNDVQTDVLQALKEILQSANISK